MTESRGVGDFEISWRFTPALWNFPAQIELVALVTLEVGCACESNGVHMRVIVRARRYVLGVHVHAGYARACGIHARPQTAYYV